MWHVAINNNVVKELKKRGKIPIEVNSAVIALVAALQLGPIVNWPNYGKLKNQSRDEDCRHCHLQRGKPTWVACWKVDKLKKIIEVYYVGTHEKAPY